MYEKYVKIQLISDLNIVNIFGNGCTIFGVIQIQVPNALFDVKKFITEQSGPRKSTLMTFLNLANIFNTIHRTKLIQIYWLPMKYLQQKFKFVSVQEVDIIPVMIDYNVIQSIQGPLLFLIYINNISKVTIGGKLFMFADHMVLGSMGSI